MTADRIVTGRAIGRLVGRVTGRLVGGPTGMQTGRVMGRLTCTDTCQCHPPGPGPDLIATSHVAAPEQSKTSPTGTNKSALPHSTDRSSNAVITCTSGQTAGSGKSLVMVNRSS